MEKDLAVEMSSWTVEKLGLKYNTYVGNGNSLSYGVVEQAMREKYGIEYLIV